ncbi:unnamed protein product [Didymodactylos carnosus]|uniref:Uncharacterized protein n=1 Tax=Didymodactylos carnosus TaxID=1234261 RepID=A0A813RNA1_9BILA|nr:unnamed protein product [Didymodactylos carnosus]CAF3566200.1 unnamed protein product [Didymodactylos carnosus]
MASSKFVPPTVIIEPCPCQESLTNVNHCISLPHSISTPNFYAERDTYRDLHKKIYYSKRQLNRKALSCPSLSFITSSSRWLKGSLFRTPSPSPSSDIGHFLDPENIRQFSNIRGSTLSTQTASSSRFSLYESFFDLSDNGQEKYRTLEEKKLFESITSYNKFQNEQCDDFRTKCSNWLRNI